MEVEDEYGRRMACLIEKNDERSSLGMICLGFIRFCRLGGFAYRDESFKFSPRIAADFGSQLPAMSVAYRDTDSCWAIAYRDGPLKSPISPF
ncbi:hypothetical protein E3N88_07734 [Mikania micrantha]|uniref:Uncharacterized protein n=1 Tax=Mikania micrantha TaxID=192012 RepID=A0A5N6PE87_9ASTR|nr:hypothetical protein E3N88_07734 [Mikania micrantha]